MKETLQKLNDSIIKNNFEIISSLKTNPKISPKKQLSVYIDGYRIRLGSAVKADHKAFCNYLGGKKSDKIISEFVEDTKSEYYSLDFYPLKFAEFLNDKKIPEEAKQIARLESAIAKIFMSQDSDELKAEFLLELNEAQLENFRLKPRIASQMLEFGYDIEKYLQEFRADKNPKKIAKKKIFLFIVRHHNNEIQRYYLTEEEYYLLQNIFAGNSIDDAIKNVAEKYPDSQQMINEMITQWLQKWLMNGFFAG